MFIQTHGPLVVSAVVVAEVLIGIADSTRHGTAIQALRAGTTVVAPRYGGLDSRGCGDRPVERRGGDEEPIVLERCAACGPVCPAWHDISHSQHR